MPCLWYYASRLEMPVVTPAEARLLDRLATERRRVVSRHDDAALLNEVASHPDRILQSLAAKGVLHRLGGGQYLVAEFGADEAEHSAPWHVLLDARMQRIGPYYLSFFSGLEEYGLTDHTASEATVAVFGRDAGSGRSLFVAGRRVVIARISRPDRWFGFKTKYEGRIGSYELGELERVLLDCLDRPTLAGGGETIARGWSRAVAGRLDLNRVVDYASRLSHTVARRAATMLDLLGEVTYAERLTASLGSSSQPATLFGGKYERGLPTDSRWRIAFDVPRETVLGWLAYER
jgi:predicted transcriptional regulator of viral defense system